jgi:hypothetical protein
MDPRGRSVDLFFDTIYFLEIASLPCPLIAYIGMKACRLLGPYARSLQLVLYLECVSGNINGDVAHCDGVQVFARPHECTDCV